MGSTDFKLLFESCPGLYLVLDRELCIVAASNAYLQASMTRRDDILGRNIFEVFPDNPDDPQATGVSNLRMSLERVLATSEPDTMAVQKYDVRRPDTGLFEERFWSPFNTPVRSESGELLYIIHRVEDVTEFIKMRQAGSEQSRINDELRQRAGRMEAEIYRRAQEIQEANHRLLQTTATLERHVAAGASDLQQSAEALALESRERLKTQAALRQSEEQLRQAQKMEAVGRMAGGVAHDFNNMLSVVLSYASELVESGTLSESNLLAAQQIERAGARAADLTKRLLTFSRQQVTDLRPIDLNEVLAGTFKMLQRVCKENIALSMTQGHELGRIRADAGQIEQVLMNLVVNAQDAMPDGGQINVSTLNVNLDEAYTREHLGVLPGPYVLLSVSDTGVGMDKETQSRVFEPFFTTKPRGRGTGLGLSTVFGIVKQSGGSIWLYSEPGVGTTFKLYFPRIDAAPVAPVVTVASTAVGGTETILVVEDDMQIREVVCRVLQRSGYQVIEAKGPLECLELMTGHTSRIDLLLTDVVMPQLNGPELARKIQALHPEIKVLFISGYTDDAIVHHGVLAPGVQFLQKPLTPRALTTRVREVLDQ
ncbi:MAG: ATP-binding protein [Deltaproteobacteria bacterium]|nr:ATP-binding protein [Deltaproteobacteria bacterium]